MFGQMTQIRSYATQIPQNVGNFFNPAHAITEPIRENIEVVPKFKIDSNLIIGLIAIALALITLKKVKI
tara:strand:- start:637 stop:843 length:207 start_codon:yes stop_codon:yes gene_type:complete